MGYVVFFTATGLTLRFVYTFLYIFFNWTSLHEYPARHRHPENLRRSRSEAVDVEEIITTGDILAGITANLKDGFTETVTSDGALLNNEGFKTY